MRCEVERRTSSAGRYDARQGESHAENSKGIARRRWALQRNRVVLSSKAREPLIRPAGNFPQWGKASSTAEGGPPSPEGDGYPLRRGRRTGRLRNHKRTGLEPEEIIKLQRKEEHADTQ
jgi:hypothetical protein